MLKFIKICIRSVNVEIYKNMYFDVMYAIS